MAFTANASPILPESFPILPLGTSLVSSIQATYGVVVIAIIISAFLTGILTVQTYTYYNSNFRDPVVRKTLVALVYILDLAQFTCITDYAWWYLVRNWGNTHALEIIRPTYGLFVVFGNLVIIIVQLLFLERIWVLYKRLRYFTILPLVLILTAFAFGMLGATLGLKAKPYASISTRGFDAVILGVWLGSGVAADVALAAMLSYMLHRNRTSIQKTDKLITKLIVYSINTCILTSTVALLAIIFNYVQHVSHLIFDMILCRIFSNSLLAFYNRRATLRSGGDTSNEIHLNEILVQTENAMDPGQRLNVVRMNEELPNRMDTEAKASVVERNQWDLEMYPIGNKCIEIVGQDQS